jgi:hypothetical protein
MLMKKILMGLLFITSVSRLNAQATNADTSLQGNATVTKDPRIDILGKKMAEYNESLANKLHSTRGYRLMLLSTDDRAQALQVRSQLMQLFPDQSVYMVFQSPFIKLKFGNFLERSEAEDYRKQIVAYKVVQGNIYIVPETVEVKADKINQTDER